MGFSRLIRILGVCVLAVGLTLIGGPAFAQEPGYGTGEATISLSASATRGEITASASGFEPGETVTGTVFSSPHSIGTKTADSNGRVTFTFNVCDLGLDRGPHEIKLSGRSSRSVSASFTVLRCGSGSNDGDDGDDGKDGKDGKIVNISNDSSDGSSSDDSSDGSSSDGSSSGGSSSDGSSSGSSSSDGSSSDDLAFTGLNVLVPLGIGAALLLVGGGLAVAGNRRKRSKTRV